MGGTKVEWRMCVYGVLLCFSRGQGFSVLRNDPEQQRRNLHISAGM